LKKCAAATYANAQRYLTCGMEITKAAYLISNADVASCPAADRAEFAFIGRSNVGKSSLINMLCGSHALAKTSATPGKTQLINHFEVQSKIRGRPGRLDWFLVDLPGYGYAKISQSSRRRWEQMIENYLRKRPNLCNVFVLIDSRHGPQKIDLNFLAQLGKWEVPFCLAFTKADKEKSGVVKRNVASFLEAMRQTWQFLPRHFETSALKKDGREQMLDYIGQVLIGPELDELA
jgi:GTP-binding protein